MKIIYSPRFAKSYKKLPKKMAIAFKETYKCEGTSTRQHNEPAGNQDVWHYHLHVFPRYKGDNLYLNHRDTYWPSFEEKKPYADKLRNYFKSQEKINNIL